MQAAHRTRRIIRETIISSVREFIQDSRAVGIILICCTIISLIISNSGWSDGYIHFWERELFTPAGGINLPHSVLHLINDGLMTIFFFLVALEIKRELIIGELASFKKSILPFIAALGGMICPAIIYLLWCGSTPFKSGWGVPMATDIAFSLGVLSLLGKRIPLSLKIFLTALAIIDDLGGIVTIAIYYASDIQWNYLLIAGGLMLALLVMNLLKVRRYYLYLIPGLILWYLVFNSGVHATVAGVLLAFAIPLRRIEALEHALHDPVNFIVMPLFALANTAVVLPASSSTVFSSIIHHGIAMGLVLGKPIGIFCFSFAAVKLGWAAMPSDITWKHLWGVGMIAGVGFTMSIFMATLAFSDQDTQLIAKLAIIIASLISATLGLLYLKLQTRVELLH